jgi:hypothetical protein
MWCSTSGPVASIRCFMRVPPLPSSSNSHAKLSGPGRVQGEAGYDEAPLRQTSLSRHSCVKPGATVRPVVPVAKGPSSSIRSTPGSSRMWLRRSDQKAHAAEESCQWSGVLARRG